jgi:hypothetical protein
MMSKQKSLTKEEQRAQEEQQARDEKLLADTGWVRVDARGQESDTGAFWRNTIPFQFRNALGQAERVTEGVTRDARTAAEMERKRPQPEPEEPAMEALAKLGGE